MSLQSSFPSRIARVTADQFLNGRYACPKFFDFRGIGFALIKAYQLNETTAVFNFYGLDTDADTNDGMFPNEQTGRLLSISVSYNLGTDLYDAKAKFYRADAFGEDPEVVAEFDGMYADQFCDYPEFIKYEDPKRKPEPKADPLFGDLVPDFITAIDELSNNK